MFTIIKSIKKITFIILLIIISISCLKETVETPEIQETGSVNNLEITKIIVGSSNFADKYRMIIFDLKWENNFRLGSSTDNRDAVWVFIKFRVGAGEWKHATLSTVSTDHYSTSGYIINPPSDGKGVYILSEYGTSTFNAPDISLRWNYGLDDVADETEVSVEIFGLQMVYIPEGSFYAGDNGFSMASFTKGSNDKRPWFITSENAIDVTNTISDGYYYTSSKDFWGDVWNANEDITGASFTISADFPKGFNAFYCMKYELTQQQYVDFLNTLTITQVANRYDVANYNRFGYTIHESGGVFSTKNPDRACGFLSPSDGFAFADWAGLRPMSELEFEKICRGSYITSVNGEYAWGTLYCKNVRLANGMESDREYITTSGANCYYAEENFTPQFPLNSAIFSESGKSREKSGASYYGVMEMSGNLNETCVSIGNVFGRVFTNKNGDGLLTTDGYANENNWPLIDGKGSGYRGGAFAQDQHCMQISDRTEASVEVAYDHRHIPWGFRGVRSVTD